MVRGLSILILACVAVAVLAACCSAGALSKSEITNWVRYTVPLPKSISITDKVTVPRGSVSVVMPESDNMVVGQAGWELRDTFGAHGSDTKFTVNLILGGDQAKPLQSLKNSDQAYRIYAAGPAELKLVALGPRGLYYAAKTLQQLVKAKSTDSQVTIPILTITDWPDMEDRALWGSDSYDHLKWLANCKMTHIEQISDHGIGPDLKPYARMGEERQPMFDEGPLYGIEPIPVVLHLEQSGHSVVRAFPELKGKAEGEGVMCYSQPRVTEIIADWIEGLASLPNVHEVDVWMSENLHNLPGCQCDKCKATGVDPMVLEARAVVAAYRIVQKRSGRDIGLRLLTSEATEDYNKTIISELPRDIKLIYYHSLLTYINWHYDQLRPYLSDFTKKGGWLSVCPNIGTLPGWWAPYNSLQFVHYRIKEYQDKGLKGLLGYSVPRVHYCFLNTQAAAEWTWNMKGRSEREFAVSYAVREGIKDPEKFADYILALGRVTWDAGGSDWPQRCINWIEDPIDVQLKKGTIRDFGITKWGFICQPFGSIFSEKQLDEDVALAAKAVKLADEMGVEQYKQESRYVQGLILSLKSLSELKKLAPNGKIAFDNRLEAQKYFQMYVDSIRQSIDALPKWEDTIRRASEPNRFTDRAAKPMQTELVDRMRQTAYEMGCEVK